MKSRWTKSVLWTAILVLGTQIGAAIYEMAVVAPLWTHRLPTSVRQFNTAGELVVQPFTYKIPAIAVLTLVALLMIATGLRKTAARARILFAAGVCMLIALGTMAYGLPLLRGLIVERGAGLSDAAIVASVEAWLVWSRIRLIALIVAWVTSVSALAAVASRPHRFFDLDGWRK